MRKYVMLGLVLGVTVSAMIMMFRRRGVPVVEFQEFFDSSTVADEIFGDAFEELPDRI